MKINAAAPIEALVRRPTLWLLTFFCFTSYRKQSHLSNSIPRPHPITKAQCFRPEAEGKRERRGGATHMLQKITEFVLNKKPLVVHRECTAVQWCCILGNHKLLRGMQPAHCLLSPHARQSPKFQLERSRLDIPKADFHRTFEKMQDSERLKEL